MGMGFQVRNPLYINTAVRSLLPTVFLFLQEMRGQGVETYLLCLQRRDVDIRLLLVQYLNSTAVVAAEALDSDPRVVKMELTSLGRRSELSELASLFLSED